MAASLWSNAWLICDKGVRGFPTHEVFAAHLTARNDLAVPLGGIRL